MRRAQIDISDPGGSMLMSTAGMLEESGENIPMSIADHFGRSSSVAVPAIIRLDSCRGPSLRLPGVLGAACQNPSLRLHGVGDIRGRRHSSHRAAAKLRLSL